MNLKANEWPLARKEIIYGINASYSRFENVRKLKGNDRNVRFTELSLYVVGDAISAGRRIDDEILVRAKS
jgi:hypothetical protein